MCIIIIFKGIGLQLPFLMALMASSQFDSTICLLKDKYRAKPILFMCGLSQARGIRTKGKY